ncbi:hypothetical protein LEP1GSC165_0050 [Leptospira santarosai str. CBC523]|uniref:hypothetical protein n=1 Tax=Leptospira santarosai TaxID=28183 RepID=UPI0002BE5CA8|nr:hypothetical protein [Leptospira santarosai]EMO12464.1 hypothetical protein LEP1GSC165_0050 [Leptospira santarosai str. CBC523]
MRARDLIHLQNSSRVFFFDRIQNIVDPFAIIIFQVKENPGDTKPLISIDVNLSDPLSSWAQGRVALRLLPGQTRGLRGGNYYWDLLVIRNGGEYDYDSGGMFKLIPTISRIDETIDPVVINDIYANLASTMDGKGSSLIGVAASFWTSILGAANLTVDRCLRWLYNNKLRRLPTWTGSKVLKSGTTDLDVIESGISIDSTDNLTGVKTLSLLDPPTLAEHATRRDWVESDTSTRIQAAVNLLVDGSPNSANTLRKIFEMLDNDPNFATTITNLIATKIPLSQKGTTNGVATLGSDGKVPSSQLPPSSGAVTSVNGQTGIVVLTNSDVNAAPASGISPGAITETTAKQFISAGLKGQVDEFTVISTLHQITPSPTKPFFDMARDVANGTDANWPQLGPHLRGIKCGVGDPYGTYADTFQVTAATKYDLNASIELTLSGSTTASLLSMILDDFNYYAMFKSSDGITPATTNTTLIDGYALVIRAVTDIGNGTGKIAAGTYMQLKFTNGSILNTLNPSSLKLGVSYSGGANPIGTISGATIEIYPHRRLVTGVYNATSFRWRPVFDSVLRNRDIVSPGFLSGGRILDFSQGHIHTHTDRFGVNVGIYVFNAGSYYNFMTDITSTTDSTSPPQSQSGFGPIRTGRKTQDRSLRVWMYLNAKEYVA